MTLEALYKLYKKLSTRLCCLPTVVEGALVVKNITAAEASALTAEEGMFIYVTDTDGTFISVGFWGYEGGSWTKL